MVSASKSEVNLVGIEGTKEKKLSIFITFSQCRGSMLIQFDSESYLNNNNTSKSQ